MEVDPKLVCLRCPARQLALRLHYYGDGASESESVQGASEHDAFMACNPSLAKMMTAATFRKGQRGHVDLLMQVGNDVSFVAAEMLFQVMNFNVDNGRPGVIAGANGPSFLQMAPDDNRIRKASVMTFWPAESYAKIVRARYRRVASALERPQASQRRVLPQPKPSRPFKRPLHCGTLLHVRLSCASRLSVRQGRDLVQTPFGVDGAVPTFIIESRSMSQSRGTMLETMDDWMKAGVMEAWLVDPIVADFDRLRTGLVVDVLPTFGTVTIYVRDPTTGSCTVETLANQPTSASSSTALPGFVMDFQTIWSEAMASSSNHPALISSNDLSPIITSNYYIGS